MSFIIRNLYKNNLLLRKKISRRVLDAHKKDPTIRERISKTLKERKVNCGVSNGMKKEDARKKVSEKRSLRFKDPQERFNVAKLTCQAWRDGKFNNVKTGRCKWYKYKHSNGNVYKVQGTWELAFIKWLEENNLSFKCHKGRLDYLFGGLKRSYYPDFWIDEWNSFVDIKCKIFYNEKKFEAIRESNQNVQVIVLFDKNLKNLGVILDENTKNFKHLEC